MSVCKTNIEVLGESLSTYRIRPPGALSVEAFEDRCRQCGDCVEVCPSRAIAVDADGFPYLADVLACGKCGLCADVCTGGAIEFTTRTRAGLQIIKTMEARSARW